MLKRYCAWHKKYFGKELFMGEVPAERDGTTHGLCKDCSKLLEKEIEVTKNKSNTSILPKKIQEPACPDKVGTGRFGGHNTE